MDIGPIDLRHPNLVKYPTLAGDKTAPYAEDGACN
jgi:hypothetical protein